MMKEKKDMTLMMISVLLLIVVFISTISMCNKFLNGFADREDLINLISNIVVILVFFAYYFILFVFNKSIKILVAVSFNLYSFSIFLITSYYYIVPFVGLLLSFIIFLLGNLDKKYIICYFSATISLYITVMLLQEFKILPIFIQNFSSPKDSNFAIMIGLTSMLLAVISGLYSLVSDNYQYKINLGQFKLTEREREVLLLLIDGREYKEISKELSITLSTVKFHTGNIYQKVGVSNRIALHTKIYNH